METLLAEIQYSITWTSGNDQRATLTVGGTQIKTRDFLTLALEGNALDGPPPEDQIPFAVSPHFVTYPFYDQQLTDDDNRQLRNLPPRTTPSPHQTGRPTPRTTDSPTRLNPPPEKAPPPGGGAYHNRIYAGPGGLFGGGRGQGETPAGPM